MLTGNAMMTAISDAMTVPYTKAIAPNLLCAGSQSVEKIPLQPAVVNQDGGLLCRRDGDQDQDHQHQQAGREREQREGPVAERPPGRKRRAGPAGVAGSACTVALMRQARQRTMPAS